MSVTQRPVSDVTRFHAVLPASDRVPSPPRFAFGTFPADSASSYYMSTHLPSIGVYVGANFSMFNGLLLDSEGSFLIAAELKIHPSEIDELDPSRLAALRAGSNRPVSGLVASIIPHGPAYKIYGHWMVDILPRLAVLEAAGFDLASLWYPVPTDTPRFGLDLLQLCDVPPERLIPYGAMDVLQAATLLMPTIIHNGVRFSPILRSAAELFRRNLARIGVTLASTNFPTRIFLKRTGGNRRMLNRASIETLAQRAGFTLIQPETMSLPDQFALFASAREIVGEYGSAFHTALFSAEGTVVCGLRGTKIHPGYLQSGIGEVLQQPTGYLFGSNMPNADMHDYLVSEEDFSHCLQAIFGPRGLARSRKEPEMDDRSLMKSAPTFEAVRGNREDESCTDLGQGILSVHIQNVGDVSATSSEWAGDARSGRTIEGFMFSLGNSRLDKQFTYRALRADGSFEDARPGGAYCGTSGQNVAIHGFAFDYVGRDKDLPSISYEGAFQDYSRTGPLSPGDVCKSSSGAPLVAMRIRVGLPVLTSGSASEAAALQPVSKVFSLPMGQMTDAELLGMFISMGGNYEFGLVQRKLGAEPFDLLRWGNTELVTVNHMLRDRFKHIGSADVLKISLAGGEYIIENSLYGLRWHSFVRENDSTPERILKREMARLPRQAAMLLDDLNEGRRILVRKADRMVETDGLAEFAQLVQGFGPTQILFVSEDAARDGIVQREGPNLLRGYLGSFADPADVAGQTQTAPWLSLCQKALPLVT